MMDARGSEGMFASTWRAISSGVEIVIAAALDLIGGSLGDIASRCAPPLRARGGTV